MSARSRLATAAVVILAALSLSCSLGPMPQRYALVVGIADYPGSLNDLTYTVADATDMQTLLAGQGYQVTLLTDGAASKTSIRDALAAIAGQCGEGDTFLFYYSGHGGQGAAGPGTKAETAAADPAEEWIFPYDSILTVAPWIDMANAIGDDELSEWLSSVPGANRIVILDACNSGGFIGTRVAVDAIPPDYQGTTQGALAELAPAIRLYSSFGSVGSDIGPSRAQVIAASGEEESSYEASGIDHGVFTYFLLKAAAQGDHDRDGYVTVTEAYEFVRRSIESNWNSDPALSAYSFLPHVSEGAVDSVLFYP